MQKIINLNDVVEAQRIDMGQCMCPTNCVKRKTDSRELTQEVIDLYQEAPSLEDVVEAQRIDMGQCMCPTNCVKRKADSRELTQEVENVYTRTRNKAA